MKVTTRLVIEAFVVTPLLLLLLVNVPGMMRSNYPVAGAATLILSPSVIFLMALEAYEKRISAKYIQQTLKKKDGLEVSLYDCLNLTGMKLEPLVFQAAIETAKEMNMNLMEVLKDEIN